MLDRDQETQEQNQPLIQDLRRYYNTRAEDTASLSRIRERLLQKASASLPAAGEHTEAPSSQLSQRQPGRNTRMNFAHEVARNRSRYPFLTTLAAAALLIVLVGSLALAISLRKGATGSPAVAHGWSLLAKFSGTGNKTITRQNIQVGHRYGWLITCTSSQEGTVSVSINGGGGSSMCPSNITGPLGPEADISAPVEMAPIQTFAVTTTNASISWEFFIFKGTYYPPMGIDTANWHTLLNGMNEMRGTGGDFWGGIDVTLPKTWALQFLCYGTGNITIILQSSPDPNVHPITSATAPCNGQTTFDVSSTEQGVHISQVQITTDATNDWQVALLGCTNGKPHCGISTSASTVTP